MAFIILQREVFTHWVTHLFNQQVSYTPQGSIQKGKQRRFLLGVVSDRLATVSACLGCCLAWSLSPKLDKSHILCWNVRQEERHFSLPKSSSVCCSASNARMEDLVHLHYWMPVWEILKLFRMMILEESQHKSWNGQEGSCWKLLVKPRRGMFPSPFHDEFWELLYGHFIFLP